MQRLRHALGLSTLAAEYGFTSNKICSVKTFRPVCLPRNWVFHAVNFIERLKNLAVCANTFFAVACAAACSHFATRPTPSGE